MSTCLVSIIQGFRSLQHAGADLRGFQGSMEPSQLHRWCLEPSEPEDSWNPLKPSGPQQKKANMSEI